MRRLANLMANWAFILTFPLWVGWVMMLMIAYEGFVAEETLGNSTERDMVRGRKPFWKAM